MNTVGLKKYMRCVVSVARTAPIRTGSYSPILGFNESESNRTVIIVDPWGVPRPVCEDEDGRWQLFDRDHGPVAELVFA